MPLRGLTAASLLGVALIATQAVAAQSPDVPDLTGMTVAEADAAAHALQLDLDVYWSVSGGKAGRILAQGHEVDPASARGRPSLVVIASTGYRRTTAAREFRTTGGAAYCQLDTAEDLGPHVVCWTPRTGRRFITSANNVGSTSPRRDVHAVGTRPPGFRTVGYGASWRWRSTGRDRGLQLNCYSTRKRLTCTNLRGSGFWIGRNGGWRVWGRGGF